MAKIFPSKETFVDLKDGTMIFVNKIKILTATTDYVGIPNATDVQLLQANRTTADPTFYLTKSGSQLNIDSATAGTEYVVVARTDGAVNRHKGTATPNDNNAA